ncbi:MAG: arginyltransferase [Alphaproteobacteria bacterium]|nr:arginyltransferase [Alphaproteobacteria bacterium]
MDHVALKQPHFFYTTAPLPCPYLEGRFERKLVTELAGPDGKKLHEALSRAGFRRSHAIAYAPACPNCRACIPVRIRVDDFKPDRGMRRNLAANQQLSIVRGPARATGEQYHLFTRYQDARHSGSDMALMGFYDYRSMVEDSPIESFLIEMRGQDGHLQGVCLGDALSDGLSAVYSFYETLEPKRSLGTRIVLWLIEEAKRLGLPYVYLGYWIAESRKMSYKARFQPLEAFGPSGWVSLVQKPSGNT